MTEAAEWFHLQRAGWETRADPYAAFFGPITEKVAAVVLDELNVGPGVVLLDVCCGQGTFAGMAALRGARAYGIDLADAMVVAARRRYPSTQFRSGDATELPWPDGYFDAVVCNFGIHHITDPAAALREFARATRPGGRIAFSVWDEDNDGLAVVPQSIYEGEPLIPDGVPSPPPEIEFGNSDESRAHLAAAGLDLEAIRDVELSMSYPSPSALWDGWLAAAIRTAPILEAQTPEFQRNARTRFEEATRTLADQDGTVTVPIVVNVVYAIRPASSATG